MVDRSYHRLTCGSVRGRRTEVYNFEIVIPLRRFPVRAGTRPERIRIQCLVLIIRLILTPLQQQQQKQLMMNGDPFEISQPLSTARVPEGVTQAASVVPIKKNTHLNIATDQEGFIKSWSSWYPYNMLTSGTKELKTVH